MPHALAGKLLEVDLSDGTIVQRSLDVENDDVLKYLGARGYNARLLWDLVPPAADPLGPENVLIFGTGTLSATSAPTSGRTTITCKSPATGLYLKTNVGGHFGTELKFAGYDYLVIKGRAPRPVYLLISDSESQGKTDTGAAGGVEIRDAGDLWGKDVRETTRSLERSLDDAHVQVACIGPAGENRVLFSSIMTSYYNAAARGGAGAVMGSKNL